MGLEAIELWGWGPAWLRMTLCSLGQHAPTKVEHRPYATAPDEELIIWSVSGDRRAFDQLIIRHGPFALRVASRLVANAAVAEDIVQDAMLRAWSQAGRFDSRRASFTTWLYRIVVNLCIDYSRRKRPEPLPEAFDPPDLSATAEESLQNADNSRALIAAMQTLPPNQRAALILIYQEDMSGLQAAQVLGVSVKAVERLLSRARAQLRDQLDTANLGGVSSK
jgi:RNA polymerase sigma-70 factor (ECF subfamily)